MSIDWSTQDIARLTRLCDEVRDLCSRSSTELDAVAHRVDAVGTKLCELAHVLEQSGLSKWKGIPGLNEDLNRFWIYLRSLQPSTSHSRSTTHGSSDTVRTMSQRGSMARMEREMTMYEQSLHRTKTDLVLVCTLRNLPIHDEGNVHHPASMLAPRVRHQADTFENHPSVFHPSSRTTRGGRSASIAPSTRSSIHSTTLSNAHRAVDLALRLQHQQTSSYEAIPPNSADADANNSPDSYLATNFVDDVSSLAEQAGLYVHNTDPLSSFEQLAVLEQKVMQYSSSTQSLSGQSMPYPANYQLPLVPQARTPALGHDIFSQLSSQSDDNSMRLWALGHSQSSHNRSSMNSAMGRSTSRSNESGRAPSSYVVSHASRGASPEIFPLELTSSMNEMSLADNEPRNLPTLIPMHGRVRVSLTRSQRESIDCSISSQVSESSITLSVDPMHVVTSRAGVHWRPPRAFRHCFDVHDRPIPHMVHPSVEGATAEPDAPYTVTFSKRQYVFGDDSHEGPRWTTSLMYILDQVADRTLLCETVFGKQLLMHAGTNKIVYNGHNIAQMSALALWFDPTSKDMTITLCPNLTSKQTMPKDVELKVYGRWDDSRPLRKSGILDIVVGSINRSSGREGVAMPSHYAHSVSSMASYSETINPSWQKWERAGKIKCSIEFTHRSEQTVFVELLGGQ